jgi:WD40 repeat protein
MGDDRLFHPSHQYGGELAFVLGGKAILSGGGGFLCLFDAGTGKLLFTHGRPADRPWPVVRAARALPGGTRAVFYEAGPGAMTGDIVVWDLARWKEIERSPFDPGWLRPREFSPDGRYFVGTDPSVHSLVVCDLNERSARVYHTDRPASRFMTASRALAFTPDGREYVTGYTRVEVHDSLTGRVVRDLGELPKVPPDPKSPAPPDEPFPVVLGTAVVSPDGRWVVEAGAYHPWFSFSPMYAEGVARVRDVRTGRIVCTIPSSRGQGGMTKHAMPEFDRFAFTPDGKRLFVAGAEITRTRWDVKLTTWDVETGAKVAEWPIEDGLIHYRTVPDALAVSPDGGRVALSTGGLIRMWDTATGRELFPRSGHLGGVRSVAYAPDGRTLYTLGSGRRLHAWDASTGKLLRTGPRLPFGWDPPSLTPDARWLITTTSDENHKALNRQLRDPATGEVRHTLPVGGCTPIPGRDEAAAVDGTDVVVRPIAGGPPRLRYRTVSNVARGHPFPDGKRLFVKEYIPGPFTVLDLDTGTKIASWPLPIAELKGAGPNTKVSFFGFSELAVGRTAVALPVVLEGLAERSPPHRVAVCDATSGKLLWEHVAGRWAYNYFWYDTAAFSPDGRRVAVGGDRVTLHDAATGEVLATFHGHRGGVSALAFSPDGTRLASGGHDGMTLVWDVAGK